MNTKILSNLGNKLKILRKQKGLTQEQLAEKVNVHPTYIGKIESGKNNISVLLLFKISRALDVKLLDIFDFDK
ncbi:helix-turn-helix transcriptional regulator [bacterium]|nr:helix-turn-helix transcriptional regulator [bacterium]